MSGCYRTAGGQVCRRKSLSYMPDLSAKMVLGNGLVNIDERCRKWKTVGITRDFGPQTNPVMFQKVFMAPVNQGTLESC